MTATRDISSTGLVKHRIVGADLTEGDYLDPRGKRRIAQTRRRGKAIIAKVQTRGARGADLFSAQDDALVIVWRKEN